MRSRGQTRRQHGFEFLISVLAILFSTFPALTQATDARDQVHFLERFYGDEDQGQCGYSQESNSLDARYGRWTEAAYINTDNRPGGCFQSFAILDPLNALDGLQITVELSSFAKVKQCDSPGPAVIPRSQDTKSLKWTPAYRIDTDDGETGCALSFSLQGRDDVALDVEFLPDGDPNQCPKNTGLHTVTSKAALEIRIKTDERPGGCYLRFRLRSN
jgi:hypothetical protein